MSSSIFPGWDKLDPVEWGLFSGSISIG